MIAVAEHALGPPLLVSLQPLPSHNALGRRPRTALHHQHSHAIGPIEEPRVRRSKRHTDEIHAHGFRRANIMLNLLVTGKSVGRWQVPVDIDGAAVGTRIKSSAH